MRQGLAGQFALTVALFLVPAAGWIAYTVHVNTEQVEREVEIRLGSQLVDVGTVVEGELQLALQTLQALASAPEIQADTGTCIEHLTALNRSEPFFADLARTGPDGRVYCMSSDWAVFDASGLGAYRSAAENEFGVGHLPAGRLMEGPAVVFAYPINDTNGRFVGAVMAVVGVERFLDLRTTRPLPAGSVVTIIDDENIVIARSAEPLRYVGQPIRDPDLRAAALNSDQVYEATGVDGVRRLYVGRAVEIVGHHEVTLFIGVPAAASYQPVIEEAIVDAAFTLVLLVLVGLAVALAMQRVVLRPIRHMATVADDLRSGHLDVRIRPEVAAREDEIGTLATTFNATVDQVMHQLQELEVAYRRLGELDRIKTRIIDSIAHELRTPLLVVDVQVARMRERADPIKDPTGFAALEMTERNVKRLGRLVESVIKVANLQAGRGTVNMEAVPLGRFLEGCAKEWTVNANENGIHFTVGKTTAVVRADPNVLRDALDELIENALKFTPPGGSVTIDIEPDVREVVMIIKDTGIGIAMQKPPSLEPFEPRGDPVRGGRLGAGLGIFIARGLLAKMGGSFEIDSEGPGHGTVVKICLAAA